MSNASNLNLYPIYSKTNAKKKYYNLPNFLAFYNLLSYHNHNTFVKINVSTKTLEPNYIQALRKTFTNPSYLWSGAKRRLSTTNDLINIYLDKLYIEIYNNNNVYQILFDCDNHTYQLGNLLQNDYKNSDKNSNNHFFKIITENQPYKSPTHTRRQYPLTTTSLLSKITLNLSNFNEELKIDHPIGEFLILEINSDIQSDERSCIKLTDHNIDMLQAKGALIRESESLPIMTLGS